MKQSANQKAALLRAGVIQRGKQEEDFSLAGSQVQMVEVMKTMRRMCMNSAQFWALSSAYLAHVKIAN